MIRLNRFESPVNPEFIKLGTGKYIQLKNYGEVSFIMQIVFIYLFRADTI